ncbi:MAG TPA: replicative DNA helicase [Opitutaceae bacterium]|nr:replicative DNA helicase [Opitutaceae bacterium]
MSETTDKPAARQRGAGPSPAAGSLFGRDLPHSLDAEEYLLSCCFIDGTETVGRCLEEKLSAKAFFAPSNQVIYDKLLDLYQRNLPIDVAVVAEELKAAGQLDVVGGYAYLAQVSSRIPTTAQATYFIERVRDLHVLREIIRAAGGIVERSFQLDGSVDEFVDQVEKDIFAVTQERVSDTIQHMKEPTREAFKVIDKMLHHRGELTGVPSGFKDLDQLTFGFQKQEMIILAARPSMGKTSFALNIAEAAAMPKKGAVTPVLIFSLEMSAAQLALRMLCSRARVNMKLLREGFVRQNGEEMKSLLATADEFSKSAIYIDDSSALSIMQLRAKARRIHAQLKDKGGLGFIVVDYLQLLSPTDPRVPREQQVAEASRGLKSLAKELNVPVLVLSQLNRSSEKENRTPKLADLRESGSIEQDADVVLMLARPKEADEKFQVAADSAELIVAKQRNGPVGELKLTFLRDITRFENFTQ